MRVHSPAESAEPALRRLLPLYLVVFIGFVGYSLMITVFTPMILADRGGFLAADTAPAQRSMLLGLLLSLYPLGQFLGSPVMGALSDRYGRRPVLVGSLAATTLAYAALVLALAEQSFVLLCAASFVAGVAEANIVTAQGAITDVAPVRERARFFGYIYLSVSLAYIVGPLIGGKLADPTVVDWFGPAVPFAAVFVLLVVTVVVIAAGFRETKPPADQAPASLVTAAGDAFRAIGVVATPGLGRYFLANFLLYLAIFGFFRAYPMYLVGRFQLDVSAVSEFVAWVGLPIVLVNLGLTGFLTARFSDRTTTIAAAAVTGLLVASVVLPETTAPLWPILFVAAAALAVCLPACATLLSKAAGALDQGRVMGANQALQVAAEALSGAAAGVLAAVAITLPLVALGAVAVLGAAFLLLAIPRTEAR